MCAGGNHLNRLYSYLFLRAGGSTIVVELFSLNVFGEAAHEDSDTKPCSRKKKAVRS